MASADSGCPSPAVAPATGTGNTLSDPYLISTEANLQWIKEQQNTGTTTNLLRNKYFRQTRDLDMSGCTWDAPIGDRSGVDATEWGARTFTGYYDGGGHVIEGLTVDSSGRYSGLFGRISQDVISDTDGIAVENLGFIGNITGSATAAAGGIAGEILDGGLSNVYAAGSVSTSGTSAKAGGLVGRIFVTTSQQTTISNSYSTASVSMPNGASNGYVGGLAGIVEDGTPIAATRIINSFATGLVSGKSGISGIGGLVAKVIPDHDSDFETSFYDTQTSYATSDVGTGKTTAELTTLSTFTTAPASWSIADNYDASSTWGICSAVNDGYPFLTVFYASDPCGSDPVAAGGAVPDWPVFTFQRPGGGECTAISPQYPRLNSWFTLPGADAPCYEKGSVVTGWSIPGQDWAFAPGRRVWVVDSQVFTAVLEYEWVTIEYDSNVDAKDACIADGVDLAVVDRTAITHIPRNVITDQPLWAAPVCSAPDYEFVGWTVDDPHNDPRVLPKDGTMPAPDVNSDGDAANSIHLYAVWAYIG